MNLEDSGQYESLYDVAAARYGMVRSEWIYSFGVNRPVIDSIIQFAQPLSTTKLTLLLSDCVLLTLKWFRWNHSYKFLGGIVGLGKSSIREIIVKMIPVMLAWSEAYVTVPTENELRQITQGVVNDNSMHDVLFIVDTVPTRINESSGPHARNYHNVHKPYPHLKTQVVVSLNGRIVHVSSTYPGSVSDIRIFRESSFGAHVTDDITIAADGIYQSVEQELNGGTLLIPHRRPRNGSLTDDQLSDNSFLASHRVVVEHTFGRMKRFKIAQHFRSDHWLFNNVFRIIAAFNNIERGVPLLQRRYDSVPYPEASVLPGPRYLSFEAMADDFLAREYGSEEEDGEEEETN